MTEDPSDVHALQHLATFLNKVDGLEPGTPYLLEAVFIPQGDDKHYVQSYRLTTLQIVKAEP